MPTTAWFGCATPCRARGTRWTSSSGVDTTSFRSWWRSSGATWHTNGAFSRISHAHQTGRRRRADLGDRIRAEEALGRQTTRFFAVAEGYPELKAHENTALLMEELISAESRIAFARQLYNDCCRALNNGVESFPSVLVARAFDFEEAPCFEAGELEDGPEGVG